MVSCCCEIKKSPYHPILLIAITAAFLLINAMVINYWINRYTSDTTAEYKKGYDEVYSNVEGEITSENMVWIVSEKKRLNEVVLSGQYSTEEGQVGTYTGYVYSDNTLVEELYSYAKYAFEYAANARTISEKAKTNALLYEVKGNPSLANRYHLMSKQFSGRSITNFYRTIGWDKYYSYEFSNLLVLLLVLIFVSSLFSQEKETGMNILLHITPRGLQRSRTVKIATGFFYAWFITTIFSLQDFCIFDSAYGFRGFSNPLYAILEFKDTVLNVSIGMYVFLNYAAKVLGIWVFAALVLSVSAATKTNIISFLGSVIVFFGEILIDSLIPSFSFLRLLNSIKLCAGFDGILMFGTYLPNFLWQTVVQLVVCILGVLLTCILDVKVNHSVRKGDSQCIKFLNMNGLNC